VAHPCGFLQRWGFFFWAFHFLRSNVELRFPIPRAIEVQSRAMAKRKTKKSRPSIKRKSSRSNKPAKLPKNAVALVVMMHAKPGQELILQAELTALVRPTRNEEGCLLYDLHRSTDVPGDFLFFEIWASREAHAAHKQTPHFLRWNARKDTLLASRESTFWKKIA
jgi:quinol monooxygenase YgiN